MKHRFSSHTTLIELTAALLCFMLASVMILGLFTTAYSESRAAKANGQALQLARDCAAMFAAGAALEELGYEKDANGAYVLLAEDGLRLEAKFVEKQTEVGKMESLEICVYDGKNALLTFPVSRYYNKEVIHP